MNCQAIQNTVLALPDPRHVPDVLRAHVLGCAGCRVWAEQAARLESLLANLPVPAAPADKKSALLAELSRPRFAEPAASPTVSVSFFQRNATLLAGLAAALFLAVGAWLALPHKNGVKPEVAGTPKDPFLDRIVQRDVTLARADTPAKKLQALGGLADDLSTQARSLARVASREDLQELARMYDRVVKSGIVKQAEKITPLVMTPAEVKTEFRELSAKLEQSATETGKALAEAPPEAKDALERILNAARDGQKKLAAIARDKGV